MDYKSTLLGKIVSTKREEISSAKFKESFADLKAKSTDCGPTRDFVKVFDLKALTSELPPTRIIAEMKKASPSAGELKAEYDPPKLALTYEECGAAAISVLTDAVYFKGSLQDLSSVREVSFRPLLRKDFIIDAYQVYQARAYGADCILVIAAILEPQQMADLAGLAEELKMACLIEVHDEKEAEVASRVRVGRLLMGINNRDLKTLKIDLGTTERLIPLLPKNLPLISESGLSRREDLQRLSAAGVQGFLIGETLLKAKDMRAKFKDLVGNT